MRSETDTTEISNPDRSTTVHSPAGDDARSQLSSAVHDDASGEVNPCRIRIPVPQTATNIHDIGNIEVPVRLILTALAADCPRKAATIAAMRDDFFGGDHEDEYDWSSRGGSDPDIGWEQRAELAVQRRKGAAQRDAARAALRAGAASVVEHQASFSVAAEAAHLAADVESEISAIEVECDVVEMLKKALELAWQAFVLERHYYPDEQADRRRAQLLEKAEDLATRDKGASARLRELSAGLYEC